MKHSCLPPAYIANMSDLQRDLVLQVQKRPMRQDDLLELLRWASPNQPYIVRDADDAEYVRTIRCVIYEMHSVERIISTISLRVSPRKWFVGAATTRELCRVDLVLDVLKNVPLQLPMPPELATVVEKIQIEVIQRAHIVAEFVADGTVEIVLPEDGTVPEPLLNPALEAVFQGGDPRRLRHVVKKLMLCNRRAALLQELKPSEIIACAAPRRNQISARHRRRRALSSEEPQE